MNVLNSLFGTASPSQSMLKSANKQPELALDLLLETMSGMRQQQVAVQSPVEKPLPAAPFSGSGQIIDILA